MLRTAQQQLRIKAAAVESQAPATDPASLAASPTASFRVPKDVGVGGAASGATVSAWRNVAAISFGPAVFVVLQQPHGTPTASDQPSASGAANGPRPIASSGLRSPPLPSATGAVPMNAIIVPPLLDGNENAAPIR
jgi:hypothetical protein